MCRKRIKQGRVQGGQTAGGIQAGALANWLKRAMGSGGSGAGQWRQGIGMKGVCP
ncbi:MAG: hypothetical protein R2857_08435 [Vampirovibrionales bacterium]